MKIINRNVAYQVWGRIWDRVWYQVADQIGCPVRDQTKTNFWNATLIEVQSQIEDSENEQT